MAARNFDGRRQIPATLGQELRAARRRSGLSLEEAARRARVSTPFLCRLELGKRAPSTVTADRLIKLYRDNLPWIAQCALKAEAVEDHGFAHPSRWTR